MPAPLSYHRRLRAGASASCQVWTGIPLFAATFDPSQELTAEALDGIRVLPGRPKPPPPIGDFSYVEVVGCLAAGPQNTWMLTRASAPIVPVAAASAASTPAATAKPLGTQTFHLLDAMAYAPDDHRGQKMYVRGLLIKLPGEQRITISAFEMVSPSCTD